MVVRKLFLLLFCTAAAYAGPPSITPVSELVAAAKANISQISVSAATERSSVDQVIIDVREPYEFEAGHLPGAINIPRGRLEFDILDHPVLAWILAADPDELADKEVIVYCQTGGRGALAAQSLQTMGFRNVASLHGGFEAWKKAGLPIAGVFHPES